MIQRIKRAGNRIPTGAISITANIATRNSLFSSNTLKIDNRYLFTFAIFKRHRNAHVISLLLKFHCIIACRESKTHRASKLFIEFSDKFVIFITDVQTAGNIFVQIKACTCCTQIRHHNITRTRKVHIAARMLCATQRRFRLLQCLIESKLVGFGQSHLSIATQVACATETAHKRVRKERTLELIAFLARFILRAARDKRIALHVTALVNHKSRHCLTTLHTGNRT